MSETYREEIDDITCASCPLRTLPEVWWEQNRRNSSLTPFELREELADAIYDVATKHNGRTDYVGGSEVADVMQELHLDTVRLHTLEYGDIAEVDEHGHWTAGDPGRLIVQEPNDPPGVFEAKQRDADECGAGMVAFAGCFRAIQRQTCIAKDREPREEPIFPRMDGAAGADVLRQLAAHGSDKEVMDKAHELRETMLDVTDKDGEPFASRNDMEEMGFFREANDRDPGVDRQFLLAIANGLMEVAKE